MKLCIVALSSARLRTLSFLIAVLSLLSTESSLAAGPCNCPTCSVITGNITVADGSTPPIGYLLGQSSTGPRPTSGAVSAQNLFLLNMPSCDIPCGRGPLTGSALPITCAADGHGTFTLGGSAGTLVPRTNGSGGTVSVQTGFYFSNSNAGTVTCENATPSNCAGTAQLGLVARFGSLKGTIVHRSGLPKAGVTVAVYPKNQTTGKPLRTAVTGKDGRFDFTATDAAVLLNENGEGTAPLLYVSDLVPIAASNNWGLKLCAPYFGLPPVPTCHTDLKDTSAVTNEFYVVAGYEVRAGTHASRQLVSVTSSRATEVTFTFQDDPNEPDPKDRPECEGSAGKPISLFTGNVFLDQLDASIPGLLPNDDIVIRRAYNSKNVLPGRFGLFGPGWSQLYERRLERLGTGAIRIWDEQGTAKLYTDPDGDNRFELERPYSKEEWVVSTVRYFKQGGLELYDGPNGELTQINDPTQSTFTRFRYNGPNNRMSEISINNEVKFTFTYSGNDILLRDAANTLLATYRMDNGFLTQVTYPTGDGYRFTYDATSKRLLTVADLSGRFIEKHAYQADGKGILSEIADGRERFDITYEENRTLVTNAKGVTSIYEFGSVRGERVLTKVIGGCSVCGGGGESQTWTHDPATGQVASYTDGAGNVTRYEYSPETLQRTSETRYPDPANPSIGYTTRYTYWPDGKMKSVEDPKGAKTEWTYVAEGPETVSNNWNPYEPHVTRFTYANNRLESVTNQRRKTTRFTYQGARLRTVTNPMSQVTTLEHDARGNPTRTILPATDIPSQTPTTYYDLRNRPRFIVNAGGTVNEQAGTCTDCTRYKYDLGGRVESMTDALNNRTTYEYDLYGRLEHEKQWVNATTAMTTTYTYDLVSNLESIRDARGKVTRFVHDDFNRVWKVRYPQDLGESALREEVFTYDGAGRLKTRTDRRGVVTTFTYNGLGQFKEKTYSGTMTAEPVRFNYDATGNLTSAIQGTNSLGWSYNLGNQLWSTSQSSPGITTRLDYTYLPDGSRERLILYGTPHDLYYDYDDSGRVQTIDHKGDLYTVQYDAANRRRVMSYPNGISTTYTPDNRSRLEKLTVTAPGATMLSKVKSFLTTASTNQALHDLGYAYDPVGNRRQKKVNGVAEDYTYDNLYRLDIVRQGTALLDDFGFDEVGNRQSTRATPSPNAWVYSERNELKAQGATTYSHDRNGNLVSKSDASGNWTYEWDVENRLTRVTLNGLEKVTFKYDPLGRRIEKVIPAPMGVMDGGTRYVYAYDGENLLREVILANRTQRERIYVHGPGVDQPLAVYRDTLYGRNLRRDEGAQYYHADGLGSIMSMTDQSGTQVLTRSYDSFGNLTQGATTGGYAFTGREWDPEIGLYYYRARYYDPTIGRFINEDPIGFAGGINSYAYVENNPVGFKDPRGLRPEWRPQQYPDNRALGEAMQRLEPIKQKIWDAIMAASKIVGKQARAGNLNFEHIFTPKPSSSPQSQFEQCYADCYAGIEKYSLAELSTPVAISHTIWQKEFDRLPTTLCERIWHVRAVQWLAQRAICMAGCNAAISWD